MVSVDAAAPVRLSGGIPFFSRSNGSTVRLCLNSLPQFAAFLNAFASKGIAKRGKICYDGQAHGELSKWS